MLTDLHVGMDNQDRLLPGILGKFRQSLEEIRQIADPWDLVLFSGDLVQKGTEYARLEDIFGRIWDCFKQLDCNPKLLAVPGNHDSPSPVGTTGCSQGREPLESVANHSQKPR
jgi:3',5'-cyclic AMP phosphodiesterase CpdA